VPGAGVLLQLNDVVRPAPRRDISGEGIKLGVVEGVETFQSEFERIAFLEWEGFKQAEFAIKSARKAKSVAGAISESQSKPYANGL
jgi:hypothetical protein